MSDRSIVQGSSLWQICRVDGEGEHLFVGDLEAMAAHISRLHRRTGQPHMAREHVFRPRIGATAVGLPR